jgi:hypothetical protein
MTDQNKTWPHLKFLYTIHASARCCKYLVMILPFIRKLHNQYISEMEVNSIHSYPREQIEINLYLYIPNALSPGNVHQGRQTRVWVVPVAGLNLEGEEKNSSTAGSKTSHSALTDCYIPPHFRKYVTSVTKIHIASYLITCRWNFSIY